MAQRKTDVLVEVCGDRYIQVWCDTPGRWVDEVAIIDGVNWIQPVFTKDNCLDVFVDPRYDTEDVAAEIEQLLSAEVPGIFREDSGE